MIEQLWKIKRGAISWKPQQLQTADLVCFGNAALGVAQIVFQSVEDAQDFCDRLNAYQAVNGPIAAQQFLQISAGQEVAA
jgi:hypothetical protein